MPTILQRGEIMEFRHKISTRFGGGMLHVTNRALVIEAKKKGIQFYRFRNQMAGVKTSGLRKTKLLGPEGANLFDFGFKVWGAGSIACSISETRDYCRHERNRCNHVWCSRNESMNNGRECSPSYWNKERGGD